MVKPKLYFKGGWWWCSGLGLTLCDVSPTKAYKAWLRMTSRASSGVMM